MSISAALRLLIGTLTLLGATSAASAECAWLLWVVQGATVEYVFASYTSAQACIGELDAREQRLRPDRTVLITRSAATSLNVTDAIKADFSTTYQCLPDTVPPAWAKGKGR